MPRRQVFDEPFGKWLQYLRRLTKLTVKQAAEQSRVSRDAIGRLEAGQLTGAAHLLGFVSWLSEQTNDEIQSQLQRWPMRAMQLGVRAREEGLAMQEAKGKRAATVRAFVEKRTRAQGTATKVSIVTKRTPSVEKRNK